MPDTTRRSNARSRLSPSELERLLDAPLPPRPDRAALRARPRLARRHRHEPARGGARRVDAPRRGAGRARDELDALRELGSADQPAGRADPHQPQRGCRDRVRGRRVDARDGRGAARRVGDPPRGQRSPHAIETVDKETSHTYTVSYTAALLQLARLAHALGAPTPSRRTSSLACPDAVRAAIADPQTQAIARPERLLVLAGEGPPRSRRARERSRCARRRASPPRGTTSSTCSTGTPCR